MERLSQFYYHCTCTLRWIIGRKRKKKDIKRRACEESAIRWQKKKLYDKKKILHSIDNNMVYRGDNIMSKYFRI